jgi:hypothetical protein
MDATGKSVGESRRPAVGRTVSSNWTLAMRLSKKSDTPARGGVQGLQQSWVGWWREFFALGTQPDPIPLGFRVAPGDPAAQRDFRREQAAEEAEQRGKRKSKAGYDTLAKRLDGALQALPQFSGDARTNSQTNHAQLRSLIRA